MTEKAEDVEIKKLEEMLKQIKYGDRFKPSQFANVEDAQKFIEEFKKKLPITDEAGMTVIDENISKIEEILKQRQKEENDANAKYFGTLPIADGFNYLVPQFVSGCQDERGKSLYPDFEKAHEQRHEKKGGSREDPLDPPMPKDIQDICYPFMKEWREAAINGAGRDEIMAIKTPYEKLPFKDRLVFRVKKALKMKTDPEVKKLWDVSSILKTDRKVFTDGGWNYDAWRGNDASSKYLKDLLAQPYDKMTEQMNKDLPVMRKEYFAINQQVEGMKQELAAANEEKERKLKINNLCAEIISSMEGKSHHFFQVREHAHEARVSLAKKGMMPNEEVKEPAVSGVVANDRVVEAKSKGKKLDFATAKKRGNGNSI